MSTIIERDSSSSASALLIFVLFAILIVGALGFVYTHGGLGKGGPVIENNKTIVLPTPAAPVAK